MKQIIQAHSSHKSYTPRHNLQLPTTPTSRPHHRGHHHHPQPQDKQRLHTTCRNHHIVRQRLPTVHKGLGNFPRIFKTTSCLRLRKRLNSQNKCNRWFSNSGSSASIVKVKVQVKVKAAVFFPSSFPWTHVLGVKQFFFSCQLLVEQHHHQPGLSTSGLKCEQDVCNVTLLPGPLPQCRLSVNS